ncbi:MAG: hypothetical protein ABSA72_10875 [Nitrososphaerales archaeon]
MLKEPHRLKDGPAIHSPTLDTVMMVESAIKNSNLPPSRMQLWRSLPRKTMYQTFVGVLEYLEASNKIMFDGKGRIVWVAVDNPKLEALLKASVKLRG